MRVASGPARRKRRKKILDQAKGYWGERNRSYRRAKETVFRALQFAYRDRRQKKRDFRALWIERIGAATRMHGMTYSAFIGGLQKAEIPVNRKLLADLAVRDPEAFQGFVEKAREQVAAG